MKDKELQIISEVFADLVYCKNNGHFPKGDVDRAIKSLVALMRLHFENRMEDEKTN